MEIVGYCIIKKGATTGTCVEPIDQFIGTPIRVLEFTDRGDVLVLNSKATAIATFDACDVATSFKCIVSGDGFYIYPPELNMMEQLFYTAKVMQRKGGYNEIVKRMVIALSLHSGKFNDHVLWAKQ